MFQRDNLRPVFSWIGWVNNEHHLGPHQHVRFDMSCFGGPINYASIKPRIFRQDFPVGYIQAKPVQPDYFCFSLDKERVVWELSYVDHIKDVDLRDVRDPWRYAFRRQPEFMRFPNMIAISVCDGQPDRTRNIESQIRKGRLGMFPENLREIWPNMLVHK